MSSLSSNSLNGFPILSSTATIYYGNQADVEKIEKYLLSKASRTGLAIGVTIVIIVVVIIYRIVWNKQREKVIVVEGYQSENNDVEPSKTTISRGELAKK